MLAMKRLIVVSERFYQLLPTYDAWRLTISPYATFSFCEVSFTVYTLDHGIIKDDAFDDRTSVYPLHHFTLRKHLHRPCALFNSACPPDQQHIAAFRDLLTQSLIGLNPGVVDLMLSDWRSCSTEDYCLPSVAFCDGINHCGDGSDENPDNCSKTRILRIIQGNLTLWAPRN